MPFTMRDKVGKITGLWTVRQHEGQEELPANHPDIAAFFEENRQRLMKGIHTPLTPPRPFAAARMKLRRAADHVAEMERAINAYLSRNPVLVTYGPHKEPGYTKWDLNCIEGAPPYLSAIFGDIVHNLRASLDLMAVELVRLNKGNEKGVYFPFANSAAELEAAIKDKKMHRAAPEVVDLVRSLKPYAGGNAALRYVHDLDVLDKHQMILPMAAWAYSEGGSGVGMDHRSLVPRHLGGGMRQINEAMPAEVPGTRPARIKLTLPIGAPIGNAPSDGVPIVYGEPPDIAEMFHGLVEDFAGIVNSFELLCFGTLSE